MFIYILVAAFILLYLLLLSLLNKYSAICVKSIGWLSLRKVTFDNDYVHISISKIQLNMNLFNIRKKEFLSLDIKNVSIAFKEDKNKNTEVHNYGSPSDSPSQLDISKILTVKISQSFYHFLAYYSVFNYFNLKLVNLQVTHPLLKNNTLELDFIHFLSRYGNGNSLAYLYFNLYGGYLNDIKKTDRIKVFNNIELDLKCLSYCYSQSFSKGNVFISFKDFVVNLTLGKLKIPLDELDLSLFNKDSKPKHEAEISKAGSNKINYHELVVQVLDKISSIGIKLENFSVIKDDLNFKVANFAVNLEDIISIGLHEPQGLNESGHSSRVHSSLHKISVYLTSFIIHHKDDSLFDLTSGNMTLSTNLNKVSDSMLNHCDLKDSLNKYHMNEQKSIFDLFNIVGGIALTTPTIDIYYDQIDWFIKALNARGSHIEVPHQNSHEPINIREVLAKLDDIALKYSMIDLKLRVHLPSDPKVVPTTFDRHHNDNYIFTIDLLSLTNQFTLKAHTKRIKKKDFKTALKFKTIKFSFNENFINWNKLNVLCNYNILENKLSVNSLVKNIEVRISNEEFFHMIKRLSVLVNSHSHSYVSDMSAIPKDQSAYDDTVSYYKLMELLPNIIHSVKFITNSVQVSVCCEESFPDFFVTDTVGTEINLADFKRGLNVKLSDIGFDFNRVSEGVVFKIHSVQCWTISEIMKEKTPLKTKSAYEFSDYDKEMDAVNFDTFSEMSSLNSIFSDENYENDVVKSILYVHDLVVENSTGDKDKLVMKSPSIEGEFDVFLLWIGFYISTLINDAIVSSRDDTKKKKKSASIGHKKIMLDVDIHSVDIKVCLPQDTIVLLEVDSLVLFDIFSGFLLYFKFFRIYAIHPWTQLWARLIIIRESTIKLNEELPENGVKLQILTDGIKLSTPYQFLFFTIVDNIATFYKSCKQLNNNFKKFGTTNSYKRLFPIKEGPKVLPRINIISRRLVISLEDDPFESELSLIYQLGLIEQKERIRKWKVFDEVTTTKAKEAKMPGSNRSSEDIDKLAELTPISTKFNNPRRAVSSPITSEFDKRTTTLKKKVFHKPHHSLTSISSIPSGDPAGMKEHAQKPATVPKVVLESAVARNKLLENFSVTWIRKFKAYKLKREKAVEYKNETMWGKENVNKTFSDKYDILSYPKAAPLFSMLFNNVDLTVDKPSFAYDKIDDFLYKYSQKQPKMDYTTLIPFNINLFSSSLSLYLRDYPLPLLVFPENQRTNVPAVHLSGDIVINEKLNLQEDAMRYIYVPFVPSASFFNTKDNFYAVCIPRTLTPIKFTMNLKFKINSSDSCNLAWCKSFQPAISATMDAFDYFTKPPLDTSPKMGFWDKLSLLIHGKIDFNIANELRLYIKGSSSPYDLVGHASGMVFCWKNDVSLKINPTGKHDEFMMLESQEFSLAIPSYSNSQKDFWNAKAELMKPASLDGQDKPFQKVLMKLSSDETVKWKLGLLFERNSEEVKDGLPDQHARTYKFKPHYEVELKNPEYVTEEGHDSYKNFRSDYLHLAISVSSMSSNGKSYNTLHLSPQAFAYFYSWWDLFSNMISLPIKQGKLFDNTLLDNRPSVKMGAHLFTVKYQLILEPLYMSHMYMHSSHDDIRKNNKIAFTGVKGKLKRFTMDLHQRKELLHYVNSKLNKKYKVFSLKMNQGEVDFQDADIRLVNALFNVKSIYSYLASKLESESSSPESESFIPSSPDTPHGGSFSKYLERFEVSDNDYSWIDEDDYIEIEKDEIIGGYPKIKIIPLVFSPRFSYFREFHGNDKESAYPFGGEPSHHCLIGENHPEKTQENLAVMRSDSLKKQIRSNDELMSSLKDTSNLNDPAVKAKHKKLELETNDLKHRLHIIHCVLDDLLAGGEAHYNSSSDDGMLSEPESDSHLSTNNGSNKMGQILSTYSSRQSFLDMKKASSPHSDSKFHNRFIVHNMQLKWDNELRDLLFQYIEKVGDSKAQSYFMSSRAIKFVEDLVNNIDDNEDGRRNSMADENFGYTFKPNGEIIDNFDEEIRRTHADSHEVENSYLFKLISPQIQLVSDKDQDSCVLVTSRDIELKVISIIASDMDVTSPADKVAGLIETRYGVVFRDAHFFVFNCDTFGGNKQLVYGNSFGCAHDSQHWPPWLDVEMCYDSAPLSNQSIVEKTSIGYMYKKPNKLFSSEKREMEGNISNTQEAKVCFPKFVVRCSSDQYAAVYDIAMDLLMYSDSTRKKSINRLDKIVSVSDYDDFKGIDIRIKQLQQNIRLLTNIKLHLKLRDVVLDDQSKEDLSNLEIEVERMRIELYVLMKGLQKRRSIKSHDNLDSVFWVISADQVIWHMLSKERKPFVDLALANSYFTRMESPGGSNHNKFIVSMIQGFNLQEKTVYPALLSPLSSTPGDEPIDSSPIIAIEWNMLEPVGGISIMGSFESNIEPLKIQLDYHTAKTLYDYIFPKDDKMAASTPDITPKSSSSSTVPRSKDSDSVYSNESFHGTSSVSDLTSSHSSLASALTRQRAPKAQNLEKEAKTAISNSLKRKKKSTNTNLDSISEMVSRSSRYVSIVEIKVNSVKLCVSFKAPKHLNIIDVHDLVFKLPSLVYKDKLWSTEEFTSRLKKDIIKVVLHNAGGIIGNKFKHHKRKMITQPLKQISNYVSFTSVQDLEETGRTETNTAANRGTIVRGHIHHHQPSNSPRKQRADSKESKIYESDEMNTSQISTNDKSYIGPQFQESALPSNGGGHKASV